MMGMGEKPRKKKDENNERKTRLIHLLSPRL